MSSNAPRQPAVDENALDQMLWQQTPIVMLALDAAGRFTALNPAAAALFGHPATSLLGQPFTVVLDSFSHAKAALMVQRTLAEGSVADWELDHLSADGSLVLVGYTTCRLTGNGGAATSIGAIGTDITNKLVLTAQLAHLNQELEGALLDLEKTNSQLKMAQAQLVQSEKMRALGQMIAGVAHEINNPAAFVSNNLAQLAHALPVLHQLFAVYDPLKATADAAQKAKIRAAEEAAQIGYVWQDLTDIVNESQEGVERIRQIVLALRNFSRLDEAAHKSADLNLGLQSTLQIVRPLCKERIQIHESYAPLPPLLCHPGELNQVFLNLLTNAVQAIPDTGEIWVSTTCTEQAIFVTIRDNGAGMTAATLARLGEPFFTTKPVGEGAGLGLAVTLGIVQRHRGRVTFVSEPGHGATVTVELPTL